MEGIIFLICLALIWIIFATIQDIKQREVADWLNFSLVIFALGFRFFYDLFFNLDFMFFYQGLIGLGIFFILGNLMYYGRIFAGGDAKLMIALGSVLPFSRDFFINLKIFALFLCLFLFIGAVYGMVVSFYLSIKNHKKIKKEFSKKFNEKKRFFYFNIIIGLIFMLSGFFDSLFFILGFLFFIFPYFYFYGKAIEEICMVKKINTKYLTEGDWLYKDIKLNKKIIFADWDGLNKKQIKEIQKNYQEIKIKQGIAFVPVFLISFLVLISLYFFNLNLWNSFW